MIIEKINHKLGYGHQFYLWDHKEMHQVLYVFLKLSTFPSTPPVFLTFFLRFSVFMGLNPLPLFLKRKRKELEVFPSGPLLEYKYFVLVHLL